MINKDDNPKILPILGLNYTYKVNEFDILMLKIKTNLLENIVKTINKYQIDSVYLKKILQITDTEYDNLQELNHNEFTVDELLKYNYLLGNELDFYNTPFSLTVKQHTKAVNE